MNTKATVYIAVPLTTTKCYDEKTHLYDLVAELCEKQFFTVNAPHIDARKRDQSGPNKKFPPKSIFEWDYSRLRASDLVLAYVGLPSLGVGMELGLAAEWETPIVSFCEKGVNVSPMVLGHPSSLAHVEFDCEEDLLKELGCILSKL